MTKTGFLLVTFISFLAIGPATAAELIVPFPLAGVDSATQKTINDLFLESYQTFSPSVTSVPSDSLRCPDKACAVSAASARGADEVVYGVARKLGSKWVVSAFRVKTADQSVLASAKLDSKSIEDFEYVMRRIAEALARKKTIEDVATIENVTETEMDDSRHRRRTGFYAFGIQCGLLFPVTKGSYVNTKTTTMVYDPLTGTYHDSTYNEQLKQVVTTDLVNWFELPKNLALEWDIHSGWGAELGTHFSLLKLFSEGDYAPYLGGGPGIEYVYAGRQDGQRNTGFALNGRGGILLFRTYDFRVFSNATYKVVFNQDMDQSVTFNLGILWKKRSSEGSTGSPVLSALAIVGALVVGLVVIGLVSAAAH
jgi:hypothetical protein